MSKLVGIETVGTKLRIRLPRSVAEGSSRYIHTKLDESEQNKKKVEWVAYLIEEDIKQGSLDPTLEKYKAEFVPKVKVVKQKKHSLSELWTQYSVYRRPQVAETTYLKWYKTGFARIIDSLPTQDPKESVLIRNHLMGTLSPYMAKKTITQISACCNWAVSSEILTENPFIGMARTIRVPKFEGKIIDPFSREERDTILQAFKEHKHYHRLYPFVKFLFLTGCRTGEAVALKWKYISADCKKVIFTESFDSQVKVLKDTKTHETRIFPCNSSLQELLLEIKEMRKSTPDSLVFPAPRGGYIDLHNFTNRAWRGSYRYRGILEGLLEEGRIERYRCPYTTRSTFITMALEEGHTVSQVAALVGNSPQILLEHYAGCQLTGEVLVH